MHQSVTQQRTHQVCIAAGGQTECSIVKIERESFEPYWQHGLLKRPQVHYAQGDRKQTNQCPAGGRAMHLVTAGKADLGIFSPEQCYLLLLLFPLKSIQESHSCRLVRIE